MTILHAKTLGEILAATPDPRNFTERYPVKNREERVLLGGPKFHIISQRNGGMCWICGRGAIRPVLDHLRPRSNYATHMLWLADRSDNLHVACWDCNERRSNYYVDWMPHPIGVTGACWDCLNPRDEDSYYDENLPERPHMLEPAYCGRCGHTWVPDETWLL
jgi:hypothetical protein